MKVSNADYFNIFGQLTIYCSPIWSGFTVRLLKVAYNRIFRILMRLKNRSSMSANFVERRLNPFPVIIRKRIGYFRERVYKSDNVLLKTILESVHLMFSNLNSRWKKEYVFYTRSCNFVFNVLLISMDCIHCT